MAPAGNSIRSKSAITITNHSLSFFGTVIPVHSISRLRSYEIGRKKTEGLIYLACALVATAGGAVAYFYEIVVVAVLLAGLGVVFFTFAAYSMFYKRYGLSVETNAGSRDFLVAKNRKFAEEVLSLLWWTIENSDRSVSFVVNQDNKRIYARDGSIVNVGEIVDSNVQAGR